MPARPSFVAAIPGLHLVGKVNVYLPDELEQAVRNAGLPMSRICQQALCDALLRTVTHTQTILFNGDDDSFAYRRSWKATCSCGYEGKWRGMPAVAERDRALH